MARLLYIEASPRKKRSASTEVAKAFLAEYSKQHPRDEVEVIDLWSKKLPAFDGDVIDAKYAILNSQQATAEQQKGWKEVENVIAEFKNADKYVISIPMWNFSIPYLLKQYIDVIVQPGYTFSFSPDSGYQGLVKGKSMLLVCARGGEYSPTSHADQLDLQIRYMETILGFIGFQDIKKIIIEPTLTSPEKKSELLAQAKTEALALARTY